MQRTKPNHLEGALMFDYINRDTKLCMSLSARPGNVGTRFHNYLYREMGLNYVYKAFSTESLKDAIAGVRGLNIRGCAISMPFKESVIELLDELMPSAAAIGSVNTIVNDEGWLRAYNTDYAAVRSLLDSHNLSKDMSFVVQGSGGMAKAVAIAMRDAGFEDGTILARNEAAGRSLAELCGVQWQSDLRNLKPQILINVTPIGMAGGTEANDFAFSHEAVDAAQVVFDVVALPAETPLIKLARDLGKSVITGAEVMTLQAVEQFVLYTGQRPTQELIAKAADYSRA